MADDLTAAMPYQRVVDHQIIGITEILAGP